MDSSLTAHLSPKTSGLKIRLYRRPLALTDDPFPAVDFLIWGYFDWASLKWEDKSLLNFYVRAEQEARYPKYEEQFLCAFSRDEQNSILRSSYPLLVLTEIKFQDSLLARIRKENQGDDLFSILLHLVQEKLEELAYPQGQLDFQIFYSLGYSELIIVFRADSFQPVLEQVSSLKQCLNYRGELLVHSTYSIFGISKEAVAQWNEPNIQRASIFFSLKAGLSLPQLEAKLRSALPEENIEASPLFGKYDTEVSFIKPHSVANIAQQFLGNGILSPNHPFFKKNIHYTRTRWFYDPPAPRFIEQNLLPTDDQTGPEASCPLNKEQKMLAILNEVGQYIVEGNVRLSKKLSNPNSFFMGLLDIVNYYQQVVHNGNVSPLLREELADILATLMKVILCDMGVDPSEVDDCFEGKKKVEDLQPKRVCERDSFELAIHMLSELLQNWIQSTRMVMEGPVYNIRYINASTKIYIAYYTLVETLERALDRDYIDKNQPKPNFFTVIHHANEIKSQFLFPKSRGNQWLIPIRLDKESFFSPVHSIPYLGHEIGHYIFPDVQSRNIQFVRMVCAEIARRLFFSVVIGNHSSFLYKKIALHWSPESKETINRLACLIADQVMGQKNHGVMVLDLAEPNFPIFAEHFKNVLTSTFGFIDSSVQKASEHLTSVYQSFFETHPNHTLDPVELERHRADIVALTSDLLDCIEKGIDQPFIQESLFLTIQKVDDYQDLSDGLNQLIDAKQKRKNQFLEFASNLSKKILETVAGNRYQVDNHLVSKLIRNATSLEEKKQIAGYLASRKVYEFTEANQNAIQTCIVQFLTEKDYLLVVDFFADLFVETGADLFMVHLLNLTSTNYVEILNQKHDLLSQHASETATQVDDFMTDNHSKLIRMNILLKNWNRIFNAYQFEPSSEDYFINGINCQDLLEYLIATSEKLCEFSKNPEIQNLRIIYQSLCSACFSNGQDPSQDQLGEEINFIRQYLQIRLDMEHQ